MIRKIIYVLFGVPLALIAGFILVNFLSAVISGSISLPDWISAHKFVLGVVAAIVIYVKSNPFKKIKKK